MIYNLLLNVPFVAVCARVRNDSYQEQRLVAPVYFSDERWEKKMMHVCRLVCLCMILLM